MPLLRSNAICWILFVACGATVLGQNQTTSIQLPPDNRVAQLTQDTGADLTRRHCAVCHSTDYIVRQPRLDTQHWEAEVNKMRSVFGAQISDADARTISDYLGKHYGPPPTSGANTEAKR